MKAIDRILKKRGHLVEYIVNATTGGKDSLGEVSLKVDFGDGNLISGKGASTDVIEASARAYLNAVNRVLSIEGAHEHKDESAAASGAAI